VITIVDYGAGNLRSVENTLAAIGAEYRLTRAAADVRTAGKLILPGVGHFGQLMRAMDSLGLREALRERILAGTPFLGICLGFQALHEGSEEAPEERGFGILPGRVRRFPLEARVPHMGWNEIRPRPATRLLKDAGPKPYLYFAHSYYCPVNEATAAACTYEVDYAAALERESVFGVQFHPEKSGPLGLRIVRNFVEL
jgi:imidazole glycerol phosphate synthase glutamine amidotransferase subunit